MGDQQKGVRLQQLRQRELDGALTEAEQKELQLLVQEIERAEADYLGPATERLRHEREGIEAQNRALQALLHRKEALVARLQTVLAESQAEQQAIDEELARILGESTGAGTGTRS
jgi:hypothetical protein